ncbi:hypothetical protein EVJ58_g5857 [Rhodofomes roseus]|uniref:Major facilitator superfamily (MFS) profile domain-containing protein n=1 Tax=Rhodofomes roseus TaxID=34475 RepID=A0A4Y9YB92_9APHY|nr:hypothetical protein EVJ58_g5857 [Rhodofomes roseus]
MSNNQVALPTEPGFEDGAVQEVPSGPSDTQVDHEPAGDHPVGDTPLPKLQLFILLYIQLAEPITSTVIYPFVNQLVRKTGITGGDDDKTGYFAGLIWGRASDRLGRRPIMMSGLLGLTLSMLGFGLSKTYWALVLARCAEGALNGNVGVTKSMMAEITDETNRDRGFAFMPMIWSLGSTLGPTIGGIFSTPASRWPSVFHAEFWEMYPYFLPCMIAACISMSAFLLALCGLKETLPKTKRRRVTKNPTRAREQTAPLESSGIQLEEQDAIQLVERSGPTATRATPSASPAAEKDESKSEAIVTWSPIEPGTAVYEPVAETVAVTIRSILTAQVLYPIMNYGFLAFTDQSMVVLLPLMYSTAIGGGGLGFSSFNIGIIQGVTGILAGLVQIFTFPWFRRRFGNRSLYVASYAWYLVCVCAFPLLASLAKRAGKAGTAVWAVIVIQNIAYAATNMTWG